MLFDQIIFGPVKSRRLGVSLGVNLPPVDAKICSFNCIYCECGYNFSKKGAHMPSRQQVKKALEEKLADMKSKDEPLDVITFAGNGEPTLHKEFEEIINDTISLRNDYYPNAKVSVLSNSTEIGKESVFRALNKVDNNILKLDSAIQSTVEILDRPNSPDFSVKKLIDELKKFNGNLIIQTLFIRGEFEGKQVDNTTDEEVTAWLAALQQIKPKQVMIYTIDRATPSKNLYKASIDDLNVIADKVRALGIDVSVSG